MNWLNNGLRSSKEAVAVFHTLAQRSIPFAMRLLTEGDSFWEQYVLPRCDQTLSYTQSNEACWGGVATVMIGAVIESSRRSEGVGGGSRGGGKVGHACGVLRRRWMWSVRLQLPRGSCLLALPPERPPERTRRALKGAPRRHQGASRDLPDDHLASLEASESHPRAF